MMAADAAMPGIDTKVWLEGGSELLAETLRQEARRWHLLHQPPASLGAWRKQRQEILAGLRAAAGIGGPASPTVPLDIVYCGELRGDGFAVQRLTYQSRPGIRVTANLWRPDGPGPFPGIVGMHGHWAQGKIAARVAGRGQMLAKAGFVVLMVDAFGSGERCTRHGEFEYHGARLGAGLFTVGETLLGMQLADNMRGVDLLQSLPFVDPERIGATGASGGGNQTMWLAACDPRVKAAVPVVSVGTFESYVTRVNCVCEVLPGGLPLAEEWAVIGLCAPNAMLILNSLDDNPTFRMAEMLRTYNAAREVWHLYGCADRLACQGFDLPHGYWPPMWQHMLGWFRYWLKGEGSGRPCETPAVTELPERDLMCFKPGQRPAAVPSLLDYIRVRGRELRKAALAPAALNRRQKIAELAAMLRLRPRQTAALAGPEVRGETAGLASRKFAVESEPGVLLPCVVLEQAGANPAAATVLALHSGGKAAAAAMPEVGRLLANGRRVCLADLRHQGETRWEKSELAPDHDSARASLWLGRTILGDWVTDIRALAEILAGSGRHRRQVEIQVWGEPALAAMAAAVCGDIVAGITAIGLPSTWLVGDGVPVHGMCVAVPGALRWGDVCLLAALVSCPLELRAPLTPDGQALSATAFRAWKKEIAALSRALAARRHTN